LFLAAGGYHHHLGTNTWAGSAATAPEQSDAHLVEWTIVLPDSTRLSAVEESLRRGNFSILPEGEAGELVTRDPWGTQLRFVVR
jgi:catechol 2,3-dioxygenase